MADKINSLRVIARGGLNTNQNYLELSELAPGYATMLVNFESSLTGGYRRINGYSSFDADASEVDPDTTEGPVLGIFGFNNTASDSFEVYACRKLKSGNEYGFFLNSGGSWTLVNTGTTQNSVGVSVVRAEVFNFGADNVIIFVDGVNPALAFDGTTWYQLTSSGTGTSGSPGGNQLIDAPSVIANFKNHVFLSGDPQYPSIVVSSAPNDFLDFTAASGALQQLPGFEIVQIKPFRDELFIFGSSKIKKSIPDAASGFVIQDVTGNLGCISRDSVFELGSNLVFLSADGLRVVAGTSRIGDVELVTLSQNIHNTFSEIQNSYNLSDLRNVVIRSKAQFRYFIGDDGFDISESYGIIGSIRVTSDGAIWEFGELRGIRASCAWSGYDNGDEIILHGDYNGHVYRQEVGNSFAGSDIEAVYRTPYLDYGDTEVRKTLRTLNTFIKATGSFDISISVKYDWDDIVHINPPNYNEISQGNSVIYDGGFNYDEDHVYGAPTQPILKTNIQGTGFAVQFTYVSRGIFAPFTIQGFVTEFSINGRL